MEVQTKNTMQVVVNKQITPLSHCFSHHYNYVPLNVFNP